MEFYLHQLQADVRSPSRNFVDEELPEDIARVEAIRACDTNVAWKEEYTGARTFSSVLVGVGDAATAYADLLDTRVVGRVGDGLAQLRVSADGAVLVCTAPQDVPAELAWRVAQSVVACAGDGARVVVFTALPTLAGLPTAAPPTLAVLASSPRPAWVPAGVQGLPTCNIVTGFAASVLSHCAARGLEFAAGVSLQDGVPFPVGTLAAFGTLLPCVAASLAVPDRAQCHAAMLKAAQSHRPNPLYI